MSKNIKRNYVKLSQIDHILQRTETYAGSKTTTKNEMFVVKDNNLDMF